MSAGCRYRAGVWGIFPGAKKEASSCGEGLEDVA